MSDEYIVRRWMFIATDMDDNSTYLDADGGPDGYEPSARFNGTSREAMVEADRRVDLWESKTGCMVFRITRESHGRVADSGVDAAIDGEAK